MPSGLNYGYTAPRHQTSTRSERKPLVCFLENRKIIDKKIDAQSENWNLNRMSLVDRNILRLSAFELLFVEDLSAGIVINEALEISKRYGSTDTRAFVNGVLNSLAKIIGTKSDRD